MTVESLVTFTDWMQANAVQVDWPYEFTLYSEDDVVVQVRTDSDDDEPTEHTSNFTLFKTTDSEGYVRYPIVGDPLEAPSEIRIVRRVPYNQLTRIGNQGHFYPQTHERAFDKATMQIQQLAEESSRAIKVLQGSTAFGPFEAVAGRLIGFNDAGTRIISSDTTIHERAERIAADAALASLIGQAGPIETQIFDSQAALVLANVKPTVNGVLCLGYLLAGDGGDVFLRRVASEPAHEGKRTSGDGAWWEFVEMVAGGKKQINVLAYGIFPGTNVTDPLRDLLIGVDEDVVLENAKLNFPPGTFDLDDTIFVWGDNVEIAGAGARNTIFRQLTWSRPCFTNANPDDNDVRPEGFKVHDVGFEAWNDGVKIYWYDYLGGPEDEGETVFTVGGDPSTTEDFVWVFRGNMLETPADIAGLGTDTITITLSAPLAAGEYISIKVTNKEDLFNYPFTSLFGQGPAQRGNECTPIWFGGGDYFEAYNLWVDGFVAIIQARGDWTDLGPSTFYSKYCSIHDITFNNCEFMLCQELAKSQVYNIFGDTITESQTDDGVRDRHNPTGLLDPIYKDPHVLYWANRGTPIVSQDIYIGVLEARNRYSSNYKFRNINGLTVKAGLIRAYTRVLDLDTCEDVYCHFPEISGARDNHRDAQREALNIIQVTNATIEVGRLNVSGNLASAVAFEDGLDNLCNNVTVHIGALETNGPAGRTKDWIINKGGIDCWVFIKRWVARGEATGHLYRCREGEIAGVGFEGVDRGGVVVDFIYCRDPQTPLRIARLSTESATTAEQVTIQFRKQAIYGTYTLDANSIIDGGSQTHLIVEDNTFESISTDGDFVLNALINSTNIRHTGTLTADRTITLETTDVPKNAQFKITRGSGGAFNLNVGALKALATNTWCEVRWNGSAWILMQYGAL